MAASALQTPPAWFALGLYARAKQLDFEGWRTQLGNRIHLWGLLNAGITHQFHLDFQKIKQSPFFDLGFVDDYASNKSASALTYGVANAIVSALAPLAPNWRTSCDQKLLDSAYDSFGMYAHLTIDLHASETEITRDFKAWLKPALAENRQRFPRLREAGITAAVIASWSDYEILPYQDLLIWHLAEGQAMPSDTILADWLYAEGNGDKDKVRDCRSKAAQAFTLATLRQLAIASE